MILIPEIQKVVILVPRTGTGSLRRAIREAYPNAIHLYRHMEADGVPHGYDHWQKVGVVRHPLERLWSLYKFLQRFDGPHDPAYLRAMRESVQRPFTEWLIHNEVAFTTPFDRGGSRFFPFYSCRHAMPENRKSQWLYLRPDLGTAVYQYGALNALADALGLDGIPVTANVTEGRAVPWSDMTPAAWDHLERFHCWDLSAVYATARQKEAV